MIRIGCYFVLNIIKLTKIEKNMFLVNSLRLGIFIFIFKQMQSSLSLRYKNFKIMLYYYKKLIHMRGRNVCCVKHKKN